MSSYCPITSHSDEYLIKGIQESAKHSRNKDEAPQAPWKVPPFRLMMVGLTTEIFLVKSPTFYGKTVEAGPLVNMLVKLAAGRELTENKLNEIVAIYQELTGTRSEAGTAALTLVRIIGRTVHCSRICRIS
ncbi:nickel-dependent hydrogenase large subunit [Shigella flexneri]